MQAVCNYVHNSLKFDYRRADATSTAIKALDAGTGVCRDFCAHRHRAGALPEHPRAILRQATWATSACRMIPRPWTSAPGSRPISAGAGTPSMPGTTSRASAASSGLRPGRGGRGHADHVRPPCAEAVRRHHREVNPSNARHRRRMKRVKAAPLPAAHPIVSNSKEVAMKSKVKSDRELNEALKQAFPASDPFSCERSRRPCRPAGEPQGTAVRQGADPSAGRQAGTAFEVSEEVSSVRSRRPNGRAAAPAPWATLQAGLRRSGHGRTRCRIAMQPDGRAGGFEGRHALCEQSVDEARKHVAGAGGGKPGRRIGVDGGAAVGGRDDGVGALQHDDGAAECRRGPRASSFEAPAAAASRTAA